MHGQTFFNSDRNLAPKVTAMITTLVRMTSALELAGVTTSLTHFLAMTPFGATVWTPVSLDLAPCIRDLLAPAAVNATLPAAKG